MREICLDTETTGLDPFQGHRIIEIGCVEVFNRVRTGKVFHAYLNPERSVPKEAFDIHGISSEFLKDKPRFHEKVEEFIAFIAESPLVIHNAQFDMKFLNHELERLGKPPLKSKAIDTLHMARGKFPGAPNSLDGLCKRFNIDLSLRTKHGALLDAELLADIYLELTGGSQVVMELASTLKGFALSRQQAEQNATPREIRAHNPSEEELAAHEAFVKTLKNPIWTN